MDTDLINNILDFKIKILQDRMDKIETALAMTPCEDNLLNHYLESTYEDMDNLLASLLHEKHLLFNPEFTYPSFEEIEIIEKQCRTSNHINCKCMNDKGCLNN